MQHSVCYDNFKFSTFSGDDYDASQNDCLLTEFSGSWVHKGFGQAGFASYFKHTFKTKKTKTGHVFCRILNQGIKI